MSEIKHLSEEESEIIHDVLSKYKFLFDRMIGTWKTKPVDIELQPDTRLYHNKPQQIPRAHRDVFKKEEEKLLQTGLLEKVSRSEWGAPTFIQKKLTVRFLSDFIKINQRISRKPLKHGVL